MPKVVIVGAGFGGIWAARTLAHAPVKLLFIEKNNYHTFPPLLYQVAAAELQAEEIAYPVRGILRHIPHAEFIMDEVVDIDFSIRVIQTVEQFIPYDYLILAAGSTTHYYGVPGAEEHTFPLKTLEDAIALRNRILSRFEHAAHERDPLLRKRALTFAVIGGGSTGVEFAGALAELAYGPFRKDYPTINFQEVTITLIEEKDQLLNGLPKRMGEYARERLTRMGVQVRLQSAVDHVTPDAVHFKNGMALPAETITWMAGVRGSIPLSWGLPVAGSRRVEVLPTLQLPDHPETYIVGDLTFLKEKGKPLPMTAPVAIQQGKAAAHNILRQIEGESPAPFHFNDRGTMITIGRKAAAVYIKGKVFTGFFAWILWLFIHLIYLIGFPNRLFVLIHWAVDYFFYERMVRLIIPGEKKEWTEVGTED